MLLRYVLVPGEFFLGIFFGSIVVLLTFAAPTAGTRSGGVPLEAARGDEANKFLRGGSE